MSKQLKESVKEKPMIFTTSYDDGLIIENKDNVHVERTIKTFEARKNNNKFEVYELFRKKKPRKIKTLKAVKGRSIKSVVKDFQTGKYFIKNKIVDDSNSDVSFIFTNYEANIKSSRTIRTKNNRAKRILASPQLMAVFYIETIKGKSYNGIFVGYSQRIDNKKLSGRDFDLAILQCERMAVGRFLNYYNLKKGSDDVATSLVTHRFMYIKRKGNMSKIQEL